MDRLTNTADTSNEHEQSEVEADDVFKGWDVQFLPSRDMEERVRVYSDLVKRCIESDESAPLETLFGDLLGLLRELRVAGEGVKIRDLVQGGGKMKADFPLHNPQVSSYYREWTENDFRTLLINIFRTLNRQERLRFVDLLKSSVRAEVQTFIDDVSGSEGM